MNALPALTTIVVEAVRRQFLTDVPPEPERLSRRRGPSPFRLALADLLERGARAVAPAGYRPAH